MAKWPSDKSFCLLARPAGDKIKFYLVKFTLTTSNPPPLLSYTVCFGANGKTGPRQRVKPGLHQPQLQVEWSVTFLYSIVVERRY